MSITETTNGIAAPTVAANGGVADMTYWDCRDDTEQLMHDSITEAVEAWADNQHPNPLPETVTVYGYMRCELPSVEKLADHLLYDVMEWLDCDYGDQVSGDATEITPDLNAAALAFATTLRAEYAVWTCKLVQKQEVRVADHVPASWLTSATLPDDSTAGATEPASLIAAHVIPTPHAEPAP